ncbi:glycoside hydrolase family 30 beta sandwich domain-containing protein [Hymenobacter monticola]|uniref:Glucosylceramidase n=1 Tax=Hymenobacter monticola TaxID=1705399 RepID=A0ABY4AZR7_9BACT|nr:glycoside hydrolase family 30 beta sandwich domain-containing protein [Hymenobacter monticola]UOE32405.1 glucosylceramidase [Hymenobacter monticola]
MLNRKFLMAVSLSAMTLAAASCSKKKEDTPDPQPPVVNPQPTSPSQVAFWLTNTDRTALFRKQTNVLNFGTATNSYPTINVDTTRTYQTMDGFGYTLTGGSATVISRMSATSRADLLRELFATDSTWLGVSYLRVSIGASDLDDRVFSYDDAAGDVGLAQFSLAPDRTALIPVLKQILAINPSIKIMGSPWSAPLWMKTNNNAKGGSLQTQYYDAYARYFVKYVQQMAAEGITIDAVTLQNEPLNPYNEPSMLMSAAEQANFIKNNIGPAFAAAGISTKIIAYDHNPDQPGYPLAVLGDAAARPYVEGSAFHNYGGSLANALAQVHNAYPNKGVYFTEFWTQAPGNLLTDFPNHVRELEIGAPRNWAKNVLEWNLASDQNYGPHTAGGCTDCLGAVTISGNSVTRNPAYYTVAHSSKFVRPGSVRIDTDAPNNLPNVAYRTPSGKKVLVVLNTSTSPQQFNIQFKGKTVASALAAGSVGTYVW